MIPADLFKTTQSLRKSGRCGEALALLRDALRRATLDAEGVDRAGRFIARELRAGEGGAKPIRVLLVGQCTTSWLTTALSAVAWGHGTTALVSEGGYDSVLQDLYAQPGGEEAPDVVVLLPWSDRFLNGQGPASGRVGDEVAFWQQAWAAVSGRLGSRILQVGYDWVIPGPLGYHMGGKAGGPVALIRELNAALRQALPEDAYFLDLDPVSGMVGRASFYDMRRYHWTKQPFSEVGARHLSEHLWAGVRALTTGPKKVLILDLDNTLWGGVVGETGPLGIALGESADGEAFRAFQRYLKDLAARGVVLAVASKNNPADAREPFEKNPDMVLTLDDFAAWEVNWEPKAVTIERISQTLNLGLDSFVFFDDNPAEREQIRQGLPEVAVVEVPEDPAEYVRALQAGLWFETTGLTGADLERVEQYAIERKRRELQQSFTTMDDYLRSLEMRAELRGMEDADLQRVVQLLAKTNQFNLTTRRHTREDVLGLLARPRSVALTLRVRDRFGDHGLVSVLIAVPEDGTEGDVLRVETWLMSCRVIGRTVEHFHFGALMDRARTLGYRTILGEFIPTKKNTPVAELYESLGFVRLPASPGEPGIRYVLDLDGGPRPATLVVEAGPS